MIRVLNDEVKNKLAKEVREAHKIALGGTHANVWIDLEDGDVWTICGEPNASYVSPAIVCVTNVAPYTLEEVFGDDSNLEEDPEGFLDWYLNEDDPNSNTLYPIGVVENWERTGLKDALEWLDRRGESED